MEDYWAHPNYNLENYFHFAKIQPLPLIKNIKNINYVFLNQHCYTQQNKERYVSLHRHVYSSILKQKLLAQIKNAWVY